MFRAANLQPNFQKLLEVLQLEFCANKINFEMAPASDIKLTNQIEQKWSHDKAISN